jgi:hypothetical protein
MSTDFREILERYLRGELELEAAARALQFQSLRVATVSPALDAQDAAELKIHRLMERIDAIEAAERLIGRPTASAMRIDSWDAPPDPTHFCFSVEVVLEGRDAQIAHRASMRLYVCTPSWLAARATERGWTWTPAPLVVVRWDPACVHEALSVLMQMGADNTWAQFIDRMHMYLSTEK